MSPDAAAHGKAVADMRAADLMTRPVHTVRADDAVDQAAALLSANNITAAPVVEPSSGDLIGIVSEGDLLRARMALAGLDGDRRPTTVADVMSRTVVTLPPDASVADVAEAMLRHNVHSVPIVDEVNGVEGIVCRHDLLRAYVRTDDVVQLDAQHRLDDYAAGRREWSVTVLDGVAVIAGRYTDEVERSVVKVLVRTVPGVLGVRRPG